LTVFARWSAKRRHPRKHTQPHKSAAQSGYDNPEICKLLNYMQDVNVGLTLTNRKLSQIRLKNR
jgi:hypothetical protein